MNRISRPDRRGVALPLALLGLVAVTLMVTTALVSGSTEAAISGAQQHASQRLYRADAGIEAFLNAQMRQQALGTPRPLSARRDSIQVDGETILIDISRLRSTQTDVPATGTTPRGFRQTQTYSLVAAPARGGRAVGAMYSTESTWYVGNLNISSAGSVAASILRIPGQSGVLSGVDLSGCADINDGSTGGTNALSISDSVELQLRENDVLESADGFTRVDRTGLSKTAFVQQILGGLTPEQFAMIANVQWGQGLPGPEGTTVDGLQIIDNQIRAGPQHTLESGLNWGCPAGAHKLENRAIPVTACTRSIQDTAYYPVIAVRAPNQSNFKIQGYGQGFLIVLGDVDLRDLNFFGVVVVTGDVQLNGTGYIGGAFVALGDATLGAEYQSQGDERVDWNGQTFVRFNRCGLNMAQQALSQQNARNAPQLFNGRTLSWFEVVR